MIEEALTYLEMGWCVYPAHSVDYRGWCSCGRRDCPTPGKHPIGRWVDFQNRLPSPREVKLWFVMDCNIGTVTGSVSKLVVVDVDDDQGRENVHKLGLTPTLTARTGGGGYHHFYYYDGKYQSKVKIVGGVDIRGEGGYIILPPSLHVSGKHYKWLEPRPMARFDPAPFEPFLQPQNGAVNSRTAWVEEMWEGVTEGTRSVSAAKLSGRYVNLGLSLDETWVIMEVWNQRNSPPLPEWELRRTVEAVYRKHMSTHPTEIQTLGELRRIILGDTS